MNKNNNSPGKGNGYVRFAVKRDSDDLDTSLIERDEGNDVFENNSEIDAKPANAFQPRLSSRVAIGGVKVKGHQPANFKLKVFVVVCGIVIVVGMTLIMHFYQNRTKIISIGDGMAGLAQLCLEEKTLTIVDHDRSQRAVIALAGNGFPSLRYEEAENCAFSSATMSGICLRWPSHKTKLQVTPFKVKSAKAIQCYKVSWSYKPENIPQDCIFLDNVKDNVKIQDEVWYDTQNFVLWPSKHPASCSEFCQQYMPGGLNSSAAVKSEKNMGGTVIEPLWLSSRAVLLKASLHSPLLACTKLCQNATPSRLCLKTQANPSGQVQSRPHEDLSNLTYIVCAAHNTTQLYEEAVHAFVKPKSFLKPDDVLFDVVNDGVYYEDLQTNQLLDVPKTKLVRDCTTLIKKPLWNIILNADEYNKATIQKEFESLHSIGGTGYVSNLTDVYTKIGDFTLRNDSKARTVDIVEALHNMRWEVMIPMSPFVNYDSESFRETVPKNLLIRNDAGTAPVLANAQLFGAEIFPGLIDFTNPEAFSWFTNKLIDLKKKSNVDYIHLFYGQASWLPRHYSLFNPLHNPSFYSTLYTNVANHISSCPVTDVAFSSQHDAQFVMLNPAKDMEDTLRVALASGMAGYPFFVPNLPSRVEDATMLSKELLEEGFIRWIQLVSFFPVAHIPWDYDTFSKRGLNVTKLTETIKHCQSLRNGPAVWPQMEKAMRDAEISGTRPIVSPIWMAPSIPPITNNGFEKEIYEVQDQFMIGDDLMVAPVVQLGKQERAIYFPSGLWKDLHRKQQKPINPDGHRWIKSYHAGLDDIPVFLRQTE